MSKNQKQRFNNFIVDKIIMIPNCEGCKYEFQTALDYLDKSYDVCFENSGKGSKGKHLLIAVIDRNGKIILS